MADVEIVTKMVDEASPVAEKISGSLGKMKKQTDGTTEAAKKYKSSLGDVVTGLTGFNIAQLSAAGALTLMISGAGKMIKAASDLTETQNKVNVVFGDSAKEVSRFGETAHIALGMSKNAAMSASSTFGNLFVSMGMATDQSKNMSLSLVKLGADLSSMHNIAGSISLDKLRAGIIGEYEPLRTLGVNLNEAMVKAKALEMGLADLDGEISVVAKTQARYALILEQTKTAHGDVARTANEAANAERALGAAKEDLAAIGGELLLPMWTGLVVTMRDSLQTTIMLTQWNKRLSESFSEHETETRKTANTYDEYYEEVLRAAKATGQFGPTIHLTEQELEQMGATTAFVAEEIGALTESQWEAARSDEHLIKMLQNYRQAAEEAVEPTSDLKGALDDLKSVIDGPFGSAIEDYETKLGSLRQKQKDLRQEIDLLESKRYLTKEQKQQLQDMKDEYGEAGQAMRQLANEHEEAMKRMAFNMLSERAASDGLTENELANLTEIGKAWGLYDDKTAEVINAINSNMGQLDTENPSMLLDLLRSILGLPADKTFRFTVEYRQDGGVPPGLGDVGLGGDAPLNPVEDTDAGGSYDGRRASGGDVRRGQTVMVGEFGPELFRPAMGGTIVPTSSDMQDRGGDRQGIVIHQVSIQVMSTDPRQAAYEIESILGDRARLSSVDGTRYQGG